MQALEDAGLRLERLEQPVKAQDIDGLKYVTDRVHTPVMADESVFGPLQVIDLIKARAADIINIKLMKTGGISNAIRIADIAALYGVECMIGCMLETRSEEHTSELQSLMRISYAVFCLKNKTNKLPRYLRIERCHYL